MSTKGTYTRWGGADFNPGPACNNTSGHMTGFIFSRLLSILAFELHYISRGIHLNFILFLSLIFISSDCMVLEDYTRRLDDGDDASASVLSEALQGLTKSQVCGRECAIFDSPASLS